MTDLRDAIRERLTGGSLDSFDNSPCLLTEGCNVHGFDEMRTALLAVLELHRPEDTEYVDADGQSRASTDCTTCDTGGVPNGWPCPTVRAIAEQLGVEVSA